MPDVLLFGATGYTGRLTAQALARKGASFAIAGRNPAKLEAVAQETGAATFHTVEVGDVDGLIAALEDARALITCVGPFRELGDTAAEAAVRAGVHYVDSTGEINFIDRLIERFGSRAAEAGVVMAPAMGFDEVPADVALSLAVEDMQRPDAVVTYSLPGRASAGTLRTIATGIAGSDARWFRDGREERVATASRRRWAPLPPPLGPKQTVALPFAEGRLAPLHLELRSLELYGRVGPAQAAVMRLGAPLAGLVLSPRPVQQLVHKIFDRLPAGPGPEARARDRWVLLAEARDTNGWRNVALSGIDPYGLTAETLAAGGMKLARDGHDDAGVMAPVQAIGLATLHKELIDFGVEVQIFEPA